MSDQDLGLDVGSGFASEKLVAAREALGLTADAIQRELRLTPRVVTALESGDVQGMGQPVFARGYIRSYCKRVGIEADSFVEEYDAIIGELQPKRSRIREIASSSSASTASLNMSPKRSPIGGFLRGTLKLVVLVGVLGGAAYGVSKLDIDLGGVDLSAIFGGAETVVEADPNQLQIPGTSSTTPESGLPIPGVQDAEPTAIAEEPSVETVIESAPEPEVLPEVQTEVVTSLQQTEEHTPEPGAEAAPVVVDEPVVVAEPEPTTVAPTVEAAASIESAAPLADGVVRVSVGFSDVSWVNIKDGKGDALFNGLAERGRTLELTGIAPINFVFGRADAVSSFTFNGTTVDLAPHTKNNVARFSLSR